MISIVEVKVYAKNGKAISGWLVCRVPLAKTCAQKHLSITGSNVILLNAVIHLWHKLDRMGTSAHPKIIARLSITVQSHGHSSLQLALTGAVSCLKTLRTKSACHIWSHIPLMGVLDVTHVIPLIHNTLNQMVHIVQTISIADSL